MWAHSDLTPDLTPHELELLSLCQGDRWLILAFLNSLTSKMVETIQCFRYEAIFALVIIKKITRETPGGGTNPCPGRPRVEGLCYKKLTMEVFIFFAFKWLVDARPGINDEYFQKRFRTVNILVLSNDKYIAPNDWSSFFCHIIFLSICTQRTLKGPK